MEHSSAIRSFVKLNLLTLTDKINKVLPGGEPLFIIEEDVAAVSCKGELPDWFAPLVSGSGLPADGKSIGSAIETLFAAVLRSALPASLAKMIEVRAAKGVDIPAAGLGIKSPSENLCASDPFVSPYQRLLGQPHDTVVLLTDYQLKKSTRPLLPQVLKSAYYRGSQMSDRSICEIARKWRSLLANDEPQLKKLLRFLVYSNQSDPVARRILTQLKSSCQNMTKIITAADQWAEKWGYGGAHWPTDKEWSAILSSSLDGKCGMSDARQWRYRFSADLE